MYNEVTRGGAHKRDMRIENTLEINFRQVQSPYSFFFSESVSDRPNQLVSDAIPLLLFSVWRRSSRDRSRSALYSSHEIFAAATARLSSSSLGGRLRPGSGRTAA